MRHLLPPMKRLVRPPSVEEAAVADIERIVTALRQDRVYFLMYWNSMRERSPLVDAVQHGWTAHSAETLLGLPIERMRAAERFFGALEDFRIYVTHTEDMPATLDATLSKAADRFSTLGAEAVRALVGRPASWEPETDGI